MCAAKGHCDRSSKMPRSYASASRSHVCRERALRQFLLKAGRTVASRSAVGVMCAAKGHCDNYLRRVSPLHAHGRSHVCRERALRHFVSRSVYCELASVGVMCAAKGHCDNNGVPFQPVHLHSRSHVCRERALRHKRLEARPKLHGRSHVCRERALRHFESVRTG